MLWDDAPEGYWLEKRRNVSPNTVTDYAGTFAHFREFLGGNVPIESVKTDHVRKRLAKLADEGLSSKSVSNAWIALSSLWTWAETELEIPHVIRGRVGGPSTSGWSSSPMHARRLAQCSTPAARICR